MGLLAAGCIALAVVAVIEWKQIAAHEQTIASLESQVRSLSSEVQTMSSRIDRLSLQTKGEQSIDRKKLETFDALTGRLNEARGQWRDFKGYRARIVKCVLSRDHDTRASLSATVEHAGPAQPESYEFELAFDYKRGNWVPDWHASDYRFRDDEPWRVMTPQIRAWFMDIIEVKAPVIPH